MTGYDHAQVLLALIFRDCLPELAPVCGGRAIGQNEGAVIARFLGGKDVAAQGGVASKVIGHPAGLGDHAVATAVLVEAVHGGKIQPEEGGDYRSHRVLHGFRGGCGCGSRGGGLRLNGDGLPDHGVIHGGDVVCIQYDQALRHGFIQAEGHGLDDVVRVQQGDFHGGDVVGVGIDGDGLDCTGNGGCQGRSGGGGASIVGGGDGGGGGQGCAEHGDQDDYNQGEACQYFCSKHYLLLFKWPLLLSESFKKVGANSIGYKLRIWKFCQDTSFQTQICQF